MNTSDTFSDDLLMTWENYRKAAKRSRELKTIVNRSRILGMALLIGGAVVGVLADQSTEWYPDTAWLSTTFAILSAITLAVAAFVSRYVLDSQYERDWVLARSQAEALKSEAYVYLVEAAPYAGENRDEILSQRGEEIIGKYVYPVNLTDEERYKRLPDDFLEMDAYIDKRITEQAEYYYEPKALENARILNRLKMISFLLGILGAIIGAASTAIDGLFGSTAWIAVVSTISGAVATYTFAGRYQYLVTSYELTARKLKSIRNAWHRLSEAEKAARKGEYVRQFENTISFENQAWMAELINKKEKNG
jgi:hypothetical protein